MSEEIGARTLLGDVDALQDMLVAHATGDRANPPDYAAARRRVLDEPALAAAAPEFVRK